MATTRTANHLAVGLSGNGKVHLAADLHTIDGRFLGHVLACNGRVMDAAGFGLDQGKVTCGACRRGVASGRILLAEVVAG